MFVVSSTLVFLGSIGSMCSSCFQWIGQMYFHAIQENLSLPVNEERCISIGRNTNQREFDVEIVTTIMAIVMLAEVYLITPKILQVLKTQDDAMVKEQFLRMVHSLFLQVATMSHWDMNILQKWSFMQYSCLNIQSWNTMTTTNIKGVVHCWS